MTGKWKMSDSEPSAWRVYDTDGSEAVYSLYEQARAAADEMNWSVEPLYRSPVCPYVTGTVTLHCTLTPFTLTDEEREAVKMAYSRLTAIPHYEAVSATLRGLLERLT